MPNKTISRGGIFINKKIFKIAFTLLIVIVALVLLHYLYPTNKKAGILESEYQKQIYFYSNKNKTKIDAVDYNPINADTLTNKNNQKKQVKKIKILTKTKANEKNKKNLKKIKTDFDVFTYPNENNIEPTNLKNKKKDFNNNFKNDNKNKKSDKANALNKFKTTNKIPNAYRYKNGTVPSHFIPDLFLTNTEPKNVEEDEIEQDFDEEFEENFENDFALEDNLKRETPKKEKLNPYEYSVKLFEKGYGLDDNSSSYEDVLNKIAKPPNANPNNVKQLLSTVQSLGAEGLLVLKIENGLLIDGKGDDFYIYTPKSSENIFDTADVSVKTKQGKIINLGRVITGTTVRTPIDLGLIGVKEATEIIIEDAMLLSNEEKNIFQSYKEPFLGFDIDSIKLINTLKIQEEKNEENTL